MKICVIIPAYNKEENIERVIREIKKVKTKLDILVVNDGSTDKTKQAALREGVRVINLSQNCGSGAALQRGIRFALRRNYSFIVQVDADGQHNPSYIPKLIQAQAASGANMIIGSRFIDKTSYHTPLLRLVCIRTLSWLISIVFEEDIKDPTSGFRLINKRLMKYFSGSYINRNPEALSIVDALSNNYSLVETGVEMRPRRAGKSKVTLVRGFMSFVRVIVTIVQRGIFRRRINED